MTISTLIFTAALGLLPLAAIAQTNQPEVTAPNYATDPGYAAYVKQQNAEAATEEAKEAAQNEASLRAYQAEKSDPSYPSCRHSAEENMAAIGKEPSGSTLDSFIAACINAAHVDYMDEQLGAETADISGAVPVTLPPDDAAGFARDIQEHCNFAPIPVGKHMTLRIYLGMDEQPHKVEVVARQTTTDLESARNAANAVAAGCHDDFPDVPDSLRYGPTAVQGTMHFGAAILTLRFIHDPDVDSDDN
jgi:hypothetical protein